MSNASYIDLEELDKIRLKVLEEFSTLLHLGIRENLFKNNLMELLNDQLIENMKLFAEQFPNQKNEQLTTYLHKFESHCNRIKSSINLINDLQARDWDQKKSNIQKSMFGFNELSKLLATTIRKLEYYSFHDSLTDLYNKRFFLAIFKYEMKRFERHQRQFCILIIDIDDFKYINDTYGHTSGDEMLKQFADLLKLKLRQSDVVARLGGDEFGVLLTDTNLENGKALAEVLRKSIKKKLFEDSKNNQFHVTVSIGITTSSQSEKTFLNLIRDADQALYAAKVAGKNQVIFLDMG